MKIILMKTLRLKIWWNHGFKLEELILLKKQNLEKLNVGDLLLQFNQTQFCKFLPLFSFLQSLEFSNSNWILKKKEKKKILLFFRVFFFFFDYFVEFWKKKKKKKIISKNSVQNKLLLGISLSLFIIYL